jgi:uncharacterized protein (DUF2147 family)
MRFLLLWILCCQAFAQIEGQWLTSDKKGIIEIYKKEDKFFGKIIGGEQRGDGTDAKNPDKKLRSREILGLTIMTNLKKGGNEFTDGKIYDPDSGSTYSCKLKLENPNTLTLRGYLGISLFGRSETWTRVVP